MIMKTQTIGKVAKQGNRLSVYIPKNDMDKFKPGDWVVIIKTRPVEFVKASEMVKE